MRRVVLLVGAALVAASVRGTAQQPQDLPRFTSSIEVTSLDVGVFDAQGRPVTDLHADDFVVKVDGQPRQVVSANWVPLQTAERPAAVAVPAGYSSNENAAGGRLIVIVVDQPNIRFGGTLGIRRAVNGFIDRLQPSDRTAVIGIGPGAASTSFTADRDRLKKTIERLAGLYQPRGIMLHNISVSEAIEIDRNVGGMLTTQVVERECRGPSMERLPPTELDACLFEIQNEARQIALTGNNDGRSTIRILRSLLEALRAIDGPKTLVFVSEGFLATDMQQDVVALGTIAAAARTSIYALRLDDSLFQMAASEARMSMSRMDDRLMRAQGMDTLVSASRGSLLNVMGNGVSAFQRIESELSGYYLLGIESGGADKDGKAHPIAVESTRRGLTVRTRRMIIATPEENAAPASAREAVAAALSTPLPVAALPLRVATYSLQGPEAGRVQLLIHADVGTDYPASRVVSLGYLITDKDGRIVDSQAATARLPTIMSGVPSPLQFSGGASLPPGEYLLKMAFAEGDRVGTVEHTINAGMAAAGAWRLSDLMVGGPLVLGEQLLQPTVGYTVVFGSVHGYVEAYGASAETLTAHFAVASTPTGAALIEADVPVYAASPTRAIFSHALLVRQLPPGRYYLRSELSSPQGRLKTLTGAFEVAPPAVLMTSATTAGETTAREIYLPVTESTLSAPFDPSTATRPETVAVFRARVPGEKQPAFDEGVRLLAARQFASAEASFKTAVTTDAESSAVLSYLAATFAASGHDLEAASAWQTALTDGSDHPEIYEWLAGALMRNRDLGTARSTLEEAIVKWPSDLRFAKPVALVYATFGQGREAIRSLERYLAQHPDDVESARMMVEWIYQLRSSNAVARTAADDVALARKYADLYLQTDGPQAALVRQWMEFLERAR